MMTQPNRILTNICTDNLPESKVFYTNLFDLKVAYDSDWFVHLTSQDGKLELGIIDRASQLVPKEYQHSPQGFYITFVVEQLESIFEIAQTSGFEIIEAPKDTAYGQRRMLIKDPNGVLVDVSAPNKNT